MEVDLAVCDALETDSAKRHAPLLHEIFEFQAALRPDSTAVEFVELGRRLTYGELDARANHLADYLRQVGLQPNDIVGIFLPRGIEQYVAMLGILKAGGSYLPIDAAFPEDRVRFTLQDAGACFVITAKGLISAGIASEAEPLLLDDLPKTDAVAASQAYGLELSAATAPEDFCYVIYTSGSTGRPKGVAISHRNAVTFVQALTEVYGVRSTDRIFQGFSIAFDASLEEIWMAFATGATLVVGTVDAMHVVDELPKRLEEFGITVFSTTPSLLSVMPRAELPALRLLIMGGEAARPDIIDKWTRPGRGLLNTYGPTEATVVATYAWCRPGTPVTIGRPLPGYHVLLLDQSGCEVPHGHEGELCIGGSGVSLCGYLNHPELNQSRFFDCDGTRFYRSGDLAQRDATGQLCYLGRIDGQVKIRGFRVELEEIETQLLLATPCETAVVALQQHPVRGSELVAFLVSRKLVAHDLRALRAALRRNLPAYMVPTHFLHLYPSEVPRLTSGKVNRRALPHPGSGRHVPQPPQADVRAPDEEPASETEAKLLSIFHRVLGERLAPSESFFDYGGNSMQAALAISCCREDHMLECLSIRDLYENPTARSLAIRLEVCRSRAAGTELAPRAPLTDAGHRLHRVSTKQYVLCVIAQTAVTLGLFTTGVYLIVCGLWIAASVGAWLMDDPWLVRNASMPVIVLAVACCGFLFPLLALAASLGLGLLLKRLLIGQFQEGDYPLWSWGYFRWWVADVIERPQRRLADYFNGSPLAAVFYRIQGARIGKNVYLAAGLSEPELVTIEDGASISSGALLRTHAFADGLLKLRRIHIGKNCFLGTHSVVGGGVRMGDNCKLHAFSALVPGIVTPEGTEWFGSPASRIDKPENNLSQLLRKHERESQPGDFWGHPLAALKVLMLQYLYTWAFGLITLVPILASLATLLWLEWATGGGPALSQLFHLSSLSGLASWPACGAVSTLNLWILLPWAFVSATVSFMARLGAIIAGKWILVGRIRPGTHPINSHAFVRRWFVRRLMDYLVSPSGARGATETLLMPTICRALGMKVGRGTEVSDVAGFQPDLVSLGEYSMLADRCQLGDPVVHCGRMTLAPVAIGDRTFVGNGAQVPITTPRVGNSSLIGVLSIPPDHPEDATDWLGCPPVQLPARQHWCAPDTRTFHPPWHLYPIRAFYNFWKMVLPGALAEMLDWVFLKVAFIAFVGLSWTGLFLIFPLIAVGSVVARMMIPLVAKWLMIGRYRPGIRFLWSHWMWRFEIVYELELRFAPGFGGLTPLLNWYYRMMGAKIGRRVIIAGGAIAEADLVTLSDDVTIEGFLQTHLFEDRVMKLGPIVVEKDCSVGEESAVLYNSRMGAYSTLGDLSLVMKNESFVAHGRYQGLPAEPVR